MKKLLIAALLTLAACGAERLIDEPDGNVQACEPGDRACTYDDGTAK